MVITRQLVAVVRARGVRAVARVLDKSPATVSLFAKGKRRLTNVDLDRLCAAYKIKLDIPPEVLEPDDPSDS